MSAVLQDKAHAVMCVLSCGVPCLVSAAVHGLYSRSSVGAPLGAHPAAYVPLCLRSDASCAVCSGIASLTNCLLAHRSSQADGGSTVRVSSDFTRGGASRRCETWIVLELCSLGSMQVRRAPAQLLGQQGSEPQSLSPSVPALLSPHGEKLRGVCIVRLAA